MDTSIESSDANVAADLVRASGGCSDEPALVWMETAWDYARLTREAFGFAQRCRDAGVAPDDRVAIVVGSWPEHVACWYGTLIAGAIVVDVNTLLADAEWLGIVRDSTPRLVVCEPAFAERLAAIVAASDLPAVLHVLEGRGRGVCGRDEATAEGDSRTIVPRSTNDRAVIAYTSGTTGLPKGAVHTHGAVRRQLDLLASLHRLSVGDVVFQSVPLFALHGYLPQVASAIRGGATVIMADKFSAEDFAAASRRHAITYTTMSSPMLRRVLELPDADRPTLDALRVVTVGGAPLQPDVRARFEEALGVHVTQGYGMTEIMGVYVADYDGAPVGSCGRQHPEGAALVVVVDDEGRRTSTGEIGEIAVHRSCALIEYWNDPERTAEAFVGDWYLTGDIGRIDDDGFFYLVDRKKDVIIRGGFNIYSAEIERALDERVEVAEAVVVGELHDRLGEVPIAYVVPADPHAPPSLAAELEEHVRNRLGSLKSVQRLELVAPDQLPRNALGKVLKRELRERPLLRSSHPTADLI